MAFARGYLSEEQLDAQVAPIRAELLALPVRVAQTAQNAIQEALLLRSLKTGTKEPVQTASRFERSSPDPGFGPVVELRRRHLHHLLDFIGIGKTLASEGIASKEAPTRPYQPPGD
jgi:hypothetical protein